MREEVKHFPRAATTLLPKRTDIDRDPEEIADPDHGRDSPRDDRTEGHHAEGEPPVPARSGLIALRPALTGSIDQQSTLGRAPWLRCAWS
jgi:hypothetical protein